MADQRKPPETPGGGPRRKRAAPTIDLKATEVPDKPDAAAQDLHPQPQAEPQPETPPETVSAAEIPPAEPAPEPAAAPESEPPVQEPEKSEPETAAAPPPPPPPPPARGGVGAGVTGGIIGALIVAALGAGAWYAGYIPSTMQQSDVPARVAALEKQVQALKNQPPQKADTAALDKSVGALSQRVSKLEGELGNLPTSDKAAMQKVAALESAAKSLRDSVNALGKKLDDTAATASKAQQSASAAQNAVNGLTQRVQNVASAQGQTPTVTAGALDTLQKKVAALESELTKTRDNLSGEVKNLLGEVDSAQKKIAAASAGDHATRVALSAAALRSAVVSGAPYAAELAQVKSLGASAKTLAPLDHFAQSGLPTRNALANELLKLVPAMRKVSGAAASSGGFLERLQANANRLVRITPVETPAGNDPSDVLARVEAEAAHADIAAALADLAKLPDKARAPAQDWIAKAKARQDALAAVRQIAAQAARALSKG